ncbi:hypothetical protein C8R44DRAFT_818310 [Mycena epipterygia]|nr:hypothetical protein C8R44DRAFT_818310 [Mycena epipterygia]
MTSVSPASEKDHQSLEQHEPAPSSSPSLIVGGRSVSAAEHRAILTEIQSKIGADQNEICVRENGQRELRESLPAVCIVLALPDDLTARIFVECLPSHGRVHPSPHTAPLLLTQICREWRVIAHSTCQLWSSIFLDFLGSHPRKAVKLLLAWVSRAKGYPLSFGLNSNNASDKLPPALLSIISPLSAQLKRLELHLTIAQFRQLRPLDGSFPLLQKLVISPSSDLDLPALLQSAPALREIRLVGQRYMSHVTLPSSGFLEMMQSLTRGNSFLTREIHFLDGLDRSLPPLEKIEIDDQISIPTFLNILKNFPRLTTFTCHIKGIGVENAIRRERRIYSYPHLRSLSLTGYRSILVLHLLNLPNLRHLELCSDLDMAVVTSFISRSGCTLQHIHFGAEDFEENCFDDEDLHARIDIDACLSTFPSLETLEINSCTNLDPWSLCLAEPALLPHLKNIIISAPKPDLDYKALIRMLRRRRRATDTAKLQSFHLAVRPASADMEEFFDSDESDEPEAECSWRPEEPASSELRRLIADGLNFVIRLHGGVTLDLPSWPDDAPAKDPDACPAFP